MNGRVVVQLESVREFVRLLRLTSYETNAKFDLLVAYSDQLSALIHSVDDIFGLMDHVVFHIGHQASEKFESEYAHIFCGAFKTLEDLLTFIELDDQSEKMQLCFFSFIKNPDNQLAKRLLTLFTKPEEVLLFVEHYRERAEKLFQYTVPFCSDLVFSPPLLRRLHDASPAIAIAASVGAVDVLSRQQALDMESVIKLVTPYRMLPHKKRLPTKFAYDEQDHKVYYETKNKETIEVKEWMLDQFKRLLSAEAHQAIRETLLQRENFIRLYQANPKFARELLVYRNLIQIFFGEVIPDLSSYIELITAHPKIARDVSLKHPHQVAVLFESTAKVRLFYSLYKEPVKLFPAELVKTIARLFTSSTNFADWLWLAECVKKRCYENTDQLTRLAAATLEISNEKTIATLFFSDAQNLIRLTEVSSYFSSKVIEWLVNNGASPSSLFADKEEFWKFLKAGGTRPSLNRFVLAVCATYPKHVNYIFEQSIQFANLDQAFVRVLISKWETFSIVVGLFEGGVTQVVKRYPLALEYGDFGHRSKQLLELVKTPDDLMCLVKSRHFRLENEHGVQGNFENQALKSFIASPECQIPILLQSFASPDVALVNLDKAHRPLLHLLIEHHIEKMQPILDLQVFMQLDANTRCKYADKAPDYVASLFKSGTVTLKDFLNTVCIADGHMPWARNSFIEVVKRQPIVFANMFVAGDKDDPRRVSSGYSIFLTTLLQLAPAVIAQAFTSDSFIAVLQNYPILAKDVLLSCKDHIAKIIPTIADLDKVNQENSVLMKLFAAEWPNEAAAHLEMLHAAPAAIPALTR